METQTSYLQRRAAEEQAAAERASAANARTLHMELAARYREAAKNGGVIIPGPEILGDLPTAAVDFKILP